MNESVLRISVPSKKLCILFQGPEMELRGENSLGIRFAISSVALGFELSFLIFGYEVLML